MGGAARDHRGDFFEDDEDSDHDGSSLNVGPLGKRSRGKLPTHEVFKHITFSDQPELSKIK